MRPRHRIRRRRRRRMRHNNLLLLLLLRRHECERPTTARQISAMFTRVEARARSLAEQPLTQAIKIFSRARRTTERRDDVEN